MPSSAMIAGPGPISLALLRLLKTLTGCNRLLDGAQRSCETLLLLLLLRLACTNIVMMWCCCALITWSSLEKVEICSSTLRIRAAVKPLSASLEYEEEGGVSAPFVCEHRLLWLVFLWRLCLDFDLWQSAAIELSRTGEPDGWDLVD